MADTLHEIQYFLESPRINPAKKRKRFNCTEPLSLRYYFDNHKWQSSSDRLMRLLQIGLEHKDYSTHRLVNYNASFKKTVSGTFHQSLLRLGNYSLAPNRNEKNSSNTYFEIEAFENAFHRNNRMLRSIDALLKNYGEIEPMPTVGIVDEASVLSLKSEIEILKSRQEDLLENAVTKQRSKQVLKLESNLKGKEPVVTFIKLLEIVVVPGQQDKLNQLASKIPDFVYVKNSYHSDPRVDGKNKKGEEVYKNTTYISEIQFESLGKIIEDKIELNLNKNETAAFFRVLCHANIIKGSHGYTYVWMEQLFKHRSDDSDNFEFISNEFRKVKDPDGKYIAAMRNRLNL